MKECILNITHTLLKTKDKVLLGHRWLMPVILSTQEAEIRRIAVQSQPGQTVWGDPISKISNTKTGLAE
jgi:hypothetical protein